MYESSFHRASHADRFSMFPRCMDARGALVAVNVALLILGVLAAENLPAAELLAGVAKVDVTDETAGPANDRLYVKALVLEHDKTTTAIVTVDAVAIGEIGPIGNDYLSNVRSQVERELDIKPTNVLINASHCHGIVRRDVGQLTFEAVKQAAQNMVPVNVGVGRGHEDRISENRRVQLKSGKEADVRHAYSMPADQQVAGVGPIDPEIGILRLDTRDGQTLAVVYNFACHPIQGVPSGRNTADLTGFASRVIEENLSEGTVALFLQGCGGDINPVLYKDVHHPRDAEPLGNLLGLSTLHALRKIQSQEDKRLTVINEVVSLPRADFAQRIIAMQAERDRLLNSLRGTTLNLKTFLPLAVKYNMASDFPSFDSHHYLHEEALGRTYYKTLDTNNRRNLEQYIRNIHTMEELTRIQTNLALLRKHQTELVDSGKRTVDVELVGLRIGEFVLLTFPGELTSAIGLNIKKASPHEYSFVAGYTNGYIYYAPTAQQLRNAGGAQEDCDSILAPQWQKIFEDKAAEMLRRL